MSLFDRFVSAGRSAPPPNRETPVPHGERHFVNGHPLDPPWPAGCAEALFGMGCFWGAERKFWRFGEGVYVTAVGYAGGSTRHPTYEDVCTGRTGHAEVVRVVYFPAILPFEALLRTFWENHDPSQGMSQGNDIGTQYRSTIYAADDAQLQAARATRDLYLLRSRRRGRRLSDWRGGGLITGPAAPSGRPAAASPSSSAAIPCAIFWGAAFHR